MENRGFKPGSRRVHLQILAEILVFCQNPRPKIRIMQEVYTSSKLVTEYLLELQAFGFLRKTEVLNRYATTAKGNIFLEKWNQIQEMLCSTEQAAKTTRAPKERQIQRVQKVFAQ